MADQNFNQGSSPSPVGGGGQKPPIDVRTMASDLNSIQGGGSPQSYTPKGPEPKPSQPAPQPGSQPSQSFDFQIPQVPTDLSAPAASPEMPIKQKKGGKGALVGIVSFVVVIALGALGYFVVYPMFSTSSPSKTQTVQINTTTENQAPTSTGETQPVAVVTTTTESTSSSETTTTPVVATSTEPVVHQSLFQNTDGSITLNNPIKASALDGLNLGTSKEPAFVEVAFDDQNGNPIGFSDLMKSLISADLTQSGLSQAFNPAYTSGFVYVDSSGQRWLGFAAKLSATSTLVDEKASFAQIFESNTNLKNFFATDPGTEGAWKNGDPTTSNRYVLFSKNGYGLDYGWKNDTLIISSSYDGYKAAIQNLK